MSEVNNFEKLVLDKCRRLGLTCIPQEDFIGFGEFEVLTNNELMCIVRFGKNRETLSLVLDTVEEEKSSIDEVLERILLEEKTHCDLDREMFSRCRNYLARDVATIGKEVCQHAVMFGRGIIKPWKYFSTLGNQLATNKQKVKEVFNEFEERLTKLLDMLNKAVEKKEREVIELTIREITNTLKSLYDKLLSCAISSKVDECKKIFKEVLHKDMYEFSKDVLNVLSKTVNGEYDVCKCSEELRKVIIKHLGEVAEALALISTNVAGL